MDMQLQAPHGLGKAKVWKNGQVSEADMVQAPRGGDNCSIGLAVQWISFLDRERNPGGMEMPVCL